MMAGEIMKYNLSQELQDEINNKLSSGNVYTKQEIDDIIDRLINNGYTKEEVNNMINETLGDINNIYTKEELDNIINGLIDSNGYSKQEVDTLINNVKTSIPDSYTKDEVDNMVTNVTTNGYTKNEVNDLINNAVNNIPDSYTKEEVDNLISNVTDTIPDSYTKEEVDTLLDSVDGDMKTEKYDASGDGIVDVAETLKDMTVSLDILNKLSESDSGNLQYDGKDITSGSDDGSSDIDEAEIQEYIESLWTI